MPQGYESPADFDDLLSGEDPDYNWAVPGLLEYGDRVIFTGGEGKGKSTLLRQMGYQMACGLVPFTGEMIEPRKVLIVDLENSKRQLRRKFKEMGTHGIIPDRGNLKIAPWAQGIDLTSNEGAAVMAGVLRQVLPDILIIGPMYKMAPDLRDETISSKLAMQLDAWRQLFGFSVIMESHQPHQVVTDDGRYRPERPFGSSLWLRWPEFGMCLEDGGVLRNWRGPREERAWPERLYWGKEWPWESGGMPTCIQCGKPLSGGQMRYCNITCGNAWRQAKFRAQKRES